MYRASYLIFCLIFYASAERVSQWSNLFVLKDHSSGNVSIQNLQSPFGIGEIDISAKPNPYNPVTTISIKGALSPKASLKIYSINGNVVWNFTHNLSKSERDIVWKSPGNGSAVYIACLQDGSKVKSLKLILLK